MTLPEVESARAHQRNNLDYFAMIAGFMEEAIKKGDMRRAKRFDQILDRLKNEIILLDNILATGKTKPKMNYRKARTQDRLIFLACMGIIYIAFITLFIVK